MKRDDTEFFTVTVHYVNGNSDAFEVPSQHWAETGSVASHLASFQHPGQLIIEVADRGLRCIPWSNILYMEVSPCPPHVPATALRKATLLTAS